MKRHGLSGSSETSYFAQEESHNAAKGLPGSCLLPKGADV